MTHKESASVYSFSPCMIVEVVEVVPVPFHYLHYIHVHHK